MALIRPRAEHREALQLIYNKFGKQEFLQNEVRDQVSKSIFRKLCDYNFIVKDEKYDHYHLVNRWKLNMDDGLVRRYVGENYGKRR
jgi:hypothetical protein